MCCSLLKINDSNWKHDVVRNGTGEGEMTVDRILDAIVLRIVSSSKTDVVIGLQVSARDERDDVIEICNRLDSGLSPCRANDLES